MWWPDRLSDFARSGCPAPAEQYTTSQEQTPATDLYAFGMTLYHLMAPKEKLPHGNDRQTAAFEDQPDPLKPIRTVAKGYSEALYKTVEACTQIRKKDRPQSVAEVQALLGDLDGPSHIGYQATTPVQGNSDIPTACGRSFLRI